MGRRPPLGRPVEGSLLGWDASQEGGCRVSGSRKQVGRWPLLHDPTQIHHRRPVRDVGDDREVVAHEQRGRDGDRALPDVARRLRTRALTETSQSRDRLSRTRSFRGRGSARAMAMRCRWPPRTRPAVFPTPTPGARLAAKSWAARVRSRLASRSGGLVRGSVTLARRSSGVEGYGRVWKTTPIFRRLGVQLPGGQESQSSPSNRAVPRRAPRRRTSERWWSSPTPTRPRGRGSRPPRTRTTPRSQQRRGSFSPPQRLLRHEIPSGDPETSSKGALTSSPPHPAPGCRRRVEADRSAGGEACRRGRPDGVLHLAAKQAAVPAVPWPGTVPSMAASGTGPTEVASGPTPAIPGCKGGRERRRAPQPRLLDDLAGVHDERSGRRLRYTPRSWVIRRTASPARRGGAAGREDLGWMSRPSAVVGSSATRSRGPPASAMGDRRHRCFMPPDIR